MSIDYNAEILPFYVSKLEGKPEYVQEEASAAGNAYPADEVRGANGEQIKINGVDTVAMVPVAPVLQDWLDAIQALAGHTVTFNAAIVNDAIVLVAIGGVDLVVAAGTAPGGLAATGLNAGTTKGGGDLSIGRADQKNEQRILTTLGVLISHLRLIGSRDEARNLHFVLSRIATGIGSGGFVYADRSSSVSGNVAVAEFVAGDGLLVETSNPGEGVVVDTVDVAIAGGALTMDDLVALINGAVPVADNLEAFNDNGKLKLVSRNGHNIDVQTGAAAGNDNATRKAGVEFAISRSKREEVAERVKGDALDYFDTNRRDLNL